jgi:5-methylcytosine-specific restriction protein A
MPTSPLQLCTSPGCGTLVPNGRCDEHRSQARYDSDSRRPNANQRGYDARWQVTRRAYLNTHPLCESVECMALPEWRRPDATDVDHVEGRGPKASDGHDHAQLQALCHPCHSTKTAKQDGGFGRRPLA